MDWLLPGTVIPAKQSDAPFIEQSVSAMFMAGGIALGQVATITGLEPYTIQNWVKREFLPPPDHKRYNMNQLCRVITINMLKSVLPMEKICGLLTYINGDMDDATDDIIDDARLYFMFVKLAAGFKMMHNGVGRDEAIDRVLAEYKEPVPGAAERVKKVLQIMLTAWAADLLNKETAKMVEQL
jgi:DNA-binding transcriptional MerR regulator